MPHIECVETSVQLGSERISDRFDQPQQQVMKQWRCELTALSRCYNLYFVANDDAIHVYQPSFPSQRLSREAELVLRPPKSSPNLAPGIDFANPHSINRILVDNLGHEEVILASCDDGDVIGYRVEAIQHAIEQRTRHSGRMKEPGNHDDIKVFLHRNVGASAWGLAVHQEARMIAISANTHQVTVLAYALADGATMCDRTDFSEQLPHGVQETPDFPTPRQLDHILVLHAQHNIPAVSFNNGGNDPSGRWLFSSSITGEATLWDLHRPHVPARVILVGHCARGKHPSVFGFDNDYCACPRPRDYPHAVWGVMFLNPRLAHEESCLDEAVSNTHNSMTNFQDLSKQKCNFTVISTRIDEYTEDQMPRGMVEASIDMVISETDSIQSEDSRLDEVLSSRDDHPLATDLEAGSSGAMSVDSVEQNDTLSEDEQDAVVESSREHSLQLQVSETPSLEGSLSVPDVSPQMAISAAVNITAINPATLWPTPLPDSFAAMFWGQDGENDTTEFEPSQHSQSYYDSLNEDWPTIARGYMPRLPIPIVPFCKVKTAPGFINQSQLSTPCLIITKEDLYLFQRPFDSAGDSSDPIAMIRKPLHPPRQGHLPTTPSDSADRHCYSTEIPELGVFIVASPYGRAGIFSLTCRKRKDRALPSYGIALEQILPFSRHDRKKILDHPDIILAGLAVGPVQGMFDRSGQHRADGRESQHRRWRLLMYYSDHTVLSYELSKSRAMESPDVSELVV